MRIFGDEAALNSSDFGRDLGNPLVTGHLKVVSVGTTVYVQIFKTDTELFAAAPIEVTADRPLEFYLESCTDTSRYFVLRIEDPKSKRHAYVECRMFYVRCGMECAE